MISFRAGKRLSMAMLASTLTHGLVLAFLMWQGLRLSPAYFTSAPVDLIETAVRTPKAPLAPVPKITRVKPQETSDLNPTKSEAEPELATEDVPAAASAGPPALAVSEHNSSEMNRYVGVLVGMLQKNRVYPKDAIAREEEGVVELAVKLGSNGDLVEALVKHPSPFRSLNEAALKTINTISHFPKPPIADGTVIELAIPMRFKIERL